MNLNFILPTDVINKTVNGWESKLTPDGLVCWGRDERNTIILATPQYSKEAPEEVPFEICDLTSHLEPDPCHILILKEEHSGIQQISQYLAIINVITLTLNNGGWVSDVKELLTKNKSGDEIIDEGEKVNRYKYLLQESEKDKSKGEFVSNPELKNFPLEPLPEKPEEVPVVIQKLHDHLFDAIIGFDIAARKLAEVYEQADAYHAAYKLPKLPVDAKYPFKKPIPKMAKKIAKWANKFLRKMQHSYPESVK